MKSRWDIVPFALGSEVTVGYRFVFFVRLGSESGQHVKCVVNRHTCTTEIDCGHSFEVHNTISGFYQHRKCNINQLRTFQSGFQ